MEIHILPLINQRIAYSLRGLGDWNDNPKNGTAKPWQRQTFDEFGGYILLIGLVDHVHVPE